MWVSLLYYFVGDSWPSQLKASLCHRRKEEAAAVEGQPLSQPGGRMLLPLEPVAIEPMHVNGEPILKNLNRTRNFVHAIRCTGQAVLLMSKGMNTGENLHFVHL